MIHTVACKDTNSFAMPVPEKRRIAVLYGVADDGWSLDWTEYYKASSIHAVQIAAQRFRPLHLMVTERYLCLYRRHQ
jgi:hypothetical protein